MAVPDDCAEPPPPRTEPGTLPKIEAGMVALQRTEQGTGAFAAGGIATERAHQQRQCRTDCIAGLGRVEADLLRELLQRCALQLGEELVGQGIGLRM